MATSVNPGDIVRFLNTVGGGKVTKVSGKLAYVEDEDGFETPVLIRECVVVGKGDAEMKNTVPEPVIQNTAAPKESLDKAPHIVISEPELHVEETPEGDSLNIVLAFEPTDSRNPVSSAIDAYIVNDSNYYISFVCFSREKSEKDWTFRYAGTIEPNIQLLLGDVPRDILPELDNICLQFVAYKRQRPFAMKKPVSVELSVDTTKFYKLHCFKPSVYFDNDVIEFAIVRDDVPFGADRLDERQLQKLLTRKIEADRKPVRRTVVKKSREDRRHEGNIVVDLHIQELVDNTRGLSNADMLNLQVDEFRRVMDENAHNKGCKIIFIHGKGEGVLRNALLKELNHRYKGNDVQDASFREYGFGATQVTIR